MKYLAGTNNIRSLQVISGQYKSYLSGISNIRPYASYLSGTSHIRQVHILSGRYKSYSIFSYFIFGIDSCNILLFTLTYNPPLYMPFFFLSLFLHSFWIFCIISWNLLNIISLSLLYFFINPYKPFQEKPQSSNSNFSIWLQLFFFIKSSNHSVSFNSFVRVLAVLLQTRFIRIFLYETSKYSDYLQKCTPQHTCMLMHRYIHIQPTFARIYISIVRPIILSYIYLMAAISNAVIAICFNSKWMPLFAIQAFFPLTLLALFSFFFSSFQRILHRQH